MLAKKSILITILFIPLIMMGQQYLKYTYGGVERDYILYLPTNLPEDAPLAFMLHGYSGSAYSMMNDCGMNEIADINKFAVCYPRGTKDEWDNNFWQVGYEFHQNETVDDVGFITALADFLQTNYKLSSQNTFCAGMSNGGDMSYLLACQASEIFRAAAPVAGCMMKWIYDSCEPENVMPIFSTNGTNDNTTWWDGDINNTDGWGAYMSVMDAINFWSDLNNTSQIEFAELPDIDPNDGSTITSEKYIHGDFNHEVWLYKIVNGGHDWPGAWGNMDVNTSEEIWSFFEMVMNSSTAGDEDIKFDNEKGINIFPNPASSYLTIETVKQSRLNYSVVNLYGKLLLNGTSNHTSVKIDISFLTEGVYFIHVDDRTFKIIKAN